MTKNAFRPRRISQHISRKVVQSIFRAFDFTSAKGSAFNLYAVINLTESAHAGAAAQFEAIRHKYRDWLTYHRRKGRQNLRPFYTFVFEAPDGHHHVNWTLYIPTELHEEFRRKLAQWVRKACASHGPFDVHCQLITGKQKALAKYLMKGVDPTFVQHFHLGEVYAPQGAFMGKRAGMSPSLSKAARDAAGYDAKRRAFRARLVG